MTTRLLLICLCGLLPAAAAPAAPAALPGGSMAPDATVVAQHSGRYGPYATMRRANEVAAWFRQQGYRAVAFHNGDGYYVDVR